MREIVFRAKDRTGIMYRDWFYGSLDLTTDSEYPYIISQDRFGNILRIDVDMNTIGQYTGLIDKNGKKIFESDIVLVSQIAPAKVFYNEENACYAFDYGKNGRPLAVDLTTDTSLEVIGNIYDNPELIGEEV